ncbi:MAG: hypothetical protein ACPGJI_04710, partial [Kangiellaceae bacterium]
MAEEKYLYANRKLSKFEIETQLDGAVFKDKSIYKIVFFADLAETEQNSHFVKMIRAVDYEVYFSKN